MDWGVRVKNCLTNFQILFDNFQSTTSHPQLEPSNPNYFLIAQWTLSAPVTRSVPWGGEVNVDCRFRPILVVELTVFFNKSCRFIDRLFGQKNVDCRKSFKYHRIVESTIFFKKYCRVVDFVSPRPL